MIFQPYTLSSYKFFYYRNMPKQALILHLFIALTSAVSKNTSSKEKSPNSAFFSKNFHMHRAKPDFIESQWFADFTLNEINPLLPLFIFLLSSN